jgi:cyanoexosortase A
MLPLEAVLPHLIEVATLTAKFATFILWHLGFDVSRQGINLLLPDGAVAVTPGCSGLSSIVRLLRLTVLVLVLFPTTWPQKVLLPLVAVGIAFVVNGIRVVVMAIVVTANQQAFTYWHEGVPARTFSFISILIFGLFCHLLLRKNEPQRDLVEL